MKNVMMLLAIALVLAIVCILVLTAVPERQKKTDLEELPEDTLDGYVKDSSDKNAPKKIESGEIERFSLTFSTLSWADEEYFHEGIYSLEAENKDGKVYVICNFDPYDGQRETKEYKTDILFLRHLDELVKKYDLASHNGRSVFVSGLPDMYGEKIDILYKSGENIYAVDNQDGFVGRDCIYEVYRLFCEYDESLVD